MSNRSFAKHSAAPPVTRARLTQGAVLLRGGLHLAAVPAGPVPPATSGDSGGAIYEKTAPLSNLTFPLGSGTAVIQDASSPAMMQAAA